MTGFRRGTDVWYYIECEPDRDTAFARHGEIPVVAEWAASFRTIIERINEPDGSMLWYDEVFHSDSGVDGEATRGLFGLVVAPDRIAEYEALHANPWPDMIAALDAAGFRNYTGFRRGNHVVYYGEFVPDLQTAMTRMDDFEVNARWGAAFEGIITTITDENGGFITAREVFHQD